MSDNDPMWPFDRGTIINFSTPAQGNLYAEICSFTGGEAVEWWHPDSVVHTLGALDGRMFIIGIYTQDNYRLIKGNESGLGIDDEEDDDHYRAGLGEDNWHTI